MNMENRPWGFRRCCKTNCGTGDSPVAITVMKQLVRENWRQRMCGVRRRGSRPGVLGAAALSTILSAPFAHAAPTQDEAKPTVVYIKPAGVKGDPWSALVAAMKKKHRVIPLAAGDVGGGRQDAGQRSGASSASALTGDIITNTLTTRKITGCTLMALDRDVYAAIDAALERPDLVRALVLVDLVPPDDANKPKPAADDDELGEWKAKIGKLQVPVLVFFRADLITGVGSAGQYLKASGLDVVEHIRARRIEGKDPILKTASASITPKLLSFLDDVREGREIESESRQRLPSGLTYIDQVIGEGESPREGQTVAARLRFRLPDGKDISPHGGMTPTWRFTYDHALTDGLYEGLRSMKVGGRRKLYIPSAMQKRQQPDPDRVTPDFVLDGQVEAITVDVFLSGVTDEPPPPPRPKWSKSLERDVGDGVRVVELKQGDGATVEDTSIVTLASNLWAGSGHMPRYKSENNPDRGVLRDLNESARCMAPGVRGMRVGGERLILCDAKTAFGDRLLPSIALTDEIVFHVRVLDAKPMPAPPHLEEIAPDAYQRVNNKVWAKDIKVGDGATPVSDSVLEFHYTMWRRDGKELADSTTMRDETCIEPFKTLSGPFKQALPGMKVGGVRQLRIQDPFGVGGKGLEPGEWVVYRVELIGVLTVQQAEARRHHDPGTPIRIDADTAKRIRQ